MIDIKPFAAEKLEKIAPVRLSFGQTARTLPVICLTETANSAEIVLDNRERVSRITLQVDLYAKTPAETEELALRASDTLIGAGLSRVFSQLLTDGDLPRMCMRFSCGVDEADGRILRL